MRIIDRDIYDGGARERQIEVFVETLDDLWHLYNLIAVGDSAGALSYRRDESATDKLREKRGEKKRMYITLMVEKVEFHDFADRLRVHGIIRAAPQDIGSHHTLNVKVGTRLRIGKAKWEEHHLKMLEEAEADARAPSILFVSLDDEECLIAAARSYGIQELAVIRAEAGGKFYRETRRRKKEDYFGAILEKIRGISSQVGNARIPTAGAGAPPTLPTGAETGSAKSATPVKSAISTRSAKSATPVKSAISTGSAKSTIPPVVILGPGFTKEEFLNYLKSGSPEIFRESTLAATGQAGMAGIREAMKKNLAGRLVEEHRISRETRLVEEFFTEVARGNDMAAYGAEDIKEALEAGAVSGLLITDELFRNELKGYENLLTKAEEKGAGIHIISTAHDAGRQLASIGGAGAILRFRVG